MKRDRIMEALSRVGQGKWYPHMTVNKLSSIANCSKSYARRWLRYFAGTQHFVIVVVEYKNNEKHIFVRKNDVDTVMSINKNIHVYAVIDNGIAHDVDNWIDTRDYGEVE